MYSRCIYCKGRLGANGVLEPFPVGRRLAFDEARGRLWVVCPVCERWNLSPMEERWETIETCERLYGTLHRCVSTDHISFAVHPGGLSLVRVGSPKRPEMAAWRYGGKLLSRRLRHYGSQLWIGSAKLAAIFPPTAFVAWPALILTGAYQGYRSRLPLLRAEGPAGETVQLTGGHAKQMRLVPHEGSWLLEVGPRRQPIVTASDEKALRLAAQLLPWINRAGGTRGGVERAVVQIERVGSPAELFASAATRLQERVGALVPGEGLIRSGPPELRLALEMAAHEDLELEAARGELTNLETAWREAEEIGSIADDLLIPERVREALRSLKRLGEVRKRA